MLMQGQLREALAAMVVSATAGDPADWSRWATWLVEGQGRKLLQLDDLARRYSLSDDVTVAGKKDWLGPRLADATGLSPPSQAGKVLD